MARQPRPKAIRLAKVRAGDAFLAPLPDGRLSACRVVRVAPAGDSVLVGAATWIGSQPPDPADPHLRQWLCLTHHGQPGEPCVLWVSSSVPATFTRLPPIPPTDEEAALDSLASSGWEYFPCQVLLQWRWDHERDQVLAEEAAAHQAEEAAQVQQGQAYKPRPTQTLQDLRRQTLFPHWVDYPEPAARRGARRIIRELIDALIAVGPDAPEPVRMDEIHHCIERFNMLDDEESFIETMEREDICGLIDEVAALVGLEDYGEALTGRRDW
jgi:hypothetical protein